MEVCEQTEAFVEEEGDLVFDHTKIIVRSSEDEYFYARIQRRLNHCSDIDLGALDLVKIPADNIWPKFEPKLTQAPDPPPENSFLKEPSLLYYGDTKASLRLDEQISNEAEVCEILKQNPHPNIARYLGCVVRAGRIRGLCFVRYPRSLSHRVKDSTPLDVDLCLQGIRKGVSHLHTLGLIHNDFNPSNTMMDGDNPVIIDFDSCKRDGDKLGLKSGTRGWAMADVTIASPENDHYSVAKLREWLVEARSGEVSSSTMPLYQ